MTLTDLGLTDEIAAYIKNNNLSGFTVGRVTQEHRERYIVSTGENEYDAEITGNLRFSANSRADFPSVGDWVAMIFMIRTLQSFIKYYHVNQYLNVRL